MNLTIKQKIAGFLLALLALFGGANSVSNLGSVSNASEYQATSTVNGTLVNYQPLCSGVGVLGSVILTSAGAANGNFYLHDATSTRTNGEWATTTLVGFATNATVGTYTFDMIFRKGLLWEQKGAVGSTTITYKCNG